MCNKIGNKCWKSINNLNRASAQTECKWSTHSMLLLTQNVKDIYPPMFYTFHINIHRNCTWSYAIIVYTLYTDTHIKYKLSTNSISVLTWNVNILHSN